MNDNHPFISAAISDRGLSEKRPQNEDSYAALSEYGFFAVADGVGGAQAGDVASQMAIEIISEAFVHKSPEADPEETMKIAIERANEAIFQMSVDLPQLASMATTIVALFTAGDAVTIGHVGDSRLYRVDASGQIFRETQDHSVVEEEVRAGRMTAEQATTHPSRNVISRALGAEQTVDVDLKMQILSPGDTFLLCSDGITRHVDDWELAAMLGSDQEPDSICDQLKEICYSRGAEDNLTAVIVRFSGKGETAIHLDETIHDIDPEQITVASVRPEPGELVEEDDSTSGPIKADDNNDEQFLMDPVHDSSGRDADIESSYSSSSVIVPAQEAAAVPEVPASRPVTAPSFTNAEPERSTASKALSAIALLLIGAALGFGSHYLMSPASDPVAVQPQPMPPLVAKSDNVPQTAFEEGRRIVDKDPAAYITANAASAQDSEDYFLLGRAFLLTGKGWEAKKSFNEAKNRLAQVEATNAKTIAAEIAMALSIIETPGAAQVFARELSSNNTGVILNSNTNSAVNAGSNTNMQSNSNAMGNANQPIP